MIKCVSLHVMRIVTGDVSFVTRLFTICSFTSSFVRLLSVLWFPKPLPQNYNLRFYSFDLDYPRQVSQGDTIHPVASDYGDNASSRISIDGVVAGRDNAGDK